MDMGLDEWGGGCGLREKYDVLMLNWVKEDRLLVPGPHLEISRLPPPRDLSRHSANSPVFGHVLLSPGNLQRS